jgi:hypothetical protein
MKGLDGFNNDNKVEGNLTEPSIAEKYAKLEAKRGYSYSEITPIK